ncbi:hypothetical protein HDV00_006308 [Rhizophlyctis rosea]|nr:hypothetical protein HDV00_006308 [Rhizophlyctis rosea]
MPIQCTVDSTGTSTSQTFRLYPDTGSGPIWLRSPNCPSGKTNIDDPNCSTIVHFFDPSQSTTYKSLNQRQNITYGTGLVSGIQSQDTISFSTFTVPSMPFLLVDSVDWNLGASQDEYSYDGYFGLPTSRQNSFLGHLANSSMISQAVFSIWLSHYDVMSPTANYVLNPQTTGELAFGGWREDAYLGMLAWLVPSGFSVHVGQLWFDVQGCRVDGTGLTVPEGTKVMVDTGTNGIIFDTSVYPTVLSALTSKGIDKTLTLQCSQTGNLPTFTFWIGGYAFVLEPKDYVFPLGNGKCKAMISSQNRGNLWSLGEPLERKYFTVWDGTSNV